MAYAPRVGSSGSGGSAGYRGPRLPGDRTGRPPPAPRRPNNRPRCLHCNEPIVAKYNGPQAYLHDRRSCLGSVTRDTLDLIRKADRIMEYSEPRLVRIPHDSDEYSLDYRERDKAIAEIQNLLAAVDGRLSYGPTGVPLDALVTEDAYSGVELLDTHPCYSLRPAGTYLGA